MGLWTMIRTCDYASMLALATCSWTAQLVMAASQEQVPMVGMWHAWLESPGGELPFEIELSRKGEVWLAWIMNGSERLEIPRVTWHQTELTLDIDYYDSKITAQLSGSGKRLDGEWKKRERGDAWTRLAFHAKAGASPRFAPVAGHKNRDVSGRWSVRLDKSDDPAVGIFGQQDDGSVMGTFLTTTGDYRYLAGRMNGDRLRLSCFDGAHAFLFDAKLGAHGTLRGDFWSRDTWHETWSAKPDPNATLPSSLALSQWTGKVALKDVAFPDTQGRRKSLDDPAYQGQARVIEIFGTWCPNCHDATEYLVDLQNRYGGRGLSILGLAFELTGDFTRDAAQVETYAKRHHVTYPILIAGTSDKNKAAQALPFLDGLKAYPTTIFIDRKGRVRGVYTGFSGPATGIEHRKLRRVFESLIEEMLASAD
jgi:thiol-disulfide isomerase/thioredoxin